MRINESTIRRIIREEARRALREAYIPPSEERQLLMQKFIQAQREIAPKFRSIYGEQPDPVDHDEQDIYALVAKINDEFERVRFDIEDYMETLKSAMQESGVTIEYNIDDYEDPPLTSIEVVESSEDEDEDDEDEDDDDSSKHL